MELIDLHIHSNASDGTLNPTQVVAAAHQKGLCAISLTDHDTVDGIKEGENAAAALNCSGKTPSRHSLEFVPGIELSCSFEGTEIHMLGLFVDIADEKFCRRIKALNDARDRRNQEMLRRFAEKGMVLTEAELRNGAEGTVITRTHFARVLAEKGYARSMDQAFKLYLSFGSYFYLPKEVAEPEEALQLLTDNGAFPVLAHPILYKLGYQKLENMIVRFKEAGLLGLEVYHSSHRQNESSRLQEIAKRQGLLPTGGSDFHGSNKPDIEIGSGRGGLRVSRLLLEDIKNTRSKP